MDKKFRHDIDVVVDRIVVREGLETRLADSLRTALDLADGIAVLDAPVKANRNAIRSLRNLPVRQWLHHSEIEPRLFSFNAPFGACPSCDGLGVELFFDERLVARSKPKDYEGRWHHGVRGSLRTLSRPSKPLRTL
nr:hypothetical protein [Sulfitobacter faviae]